MARVLAALTLGLLTGLLVGLSTAGVTASVVSALLAMAAGVVALTGVANPFLPQGDSAAARGADHNWAVAAFALTAIFGLSGGLWVRTHSALSPTPLDVAQRWQAAGLSEAAAQRLAVLQLTGATLDTAGTLAAGAQAGPTGTASVLFSGDAAEDCQRTDPDRAPDAAEALNGWRLAPDPWPGLARALAAQPRGVLRAVWEGLCEVAP